MKSQALNLIRSIRTVVKSRLNNSQILRNQEKSKVFNKIDSSRFSSTDILQYICNYYKDAVWMKVG